MEETTELLPQITIPMKKVGFLRRSLYFCMFHIFWPFTSLLCMITIPIFKFWNAKRFLYISGSSWNLVSRAKKYEDTLRFVCISDTHTRHHLIDIPDGDCIIISGDICWNVLPKEDPYEHLRNLNTWLGKLPHKYKLVIAGNHDKVCAKAGQSVVQRVLTNATYLQDSQTEIEGLKIYGSPYSPQAGNYFTAFQHKRGSDDLRKKWEQIPEGLDVLITHSPPKGYCDNKKGCEFLLEAVLSTKPKFHVFGHFHHAYGVAQNSFTTFVNAASLNELYLPFGQAIVFDIKKKQLK